MKALIAVDGSAGGFEAVRQAALVLSAEQDRIALYYSPPPIRVDRGTTDPELLKHARQSLAQAVLAEARANLPEALQQVTEDIIGQEPPKQGIVATAEGWGATLIAVGARGLGPIKRLLLGSVSSAVVSAARVPVLVARARPEGRKGKPPCVLVACEAATEDLFLAQVVNAVRWPEGTRGLTISVVQSLFAGHVPKWLEDRARSEEVDAMARAWVAEHAQDIANKQSEMAMYAASLPDAFKTNTPLVVEGHPADQILAAVHKHEVDLVVIGDRTASSVTRFLMGSTPQTVLNEAPCSVLIARSR